MKFKSVQLVLVGGLLILSVMLLFALSFKKYFFNTNFSNFGAIGDFFNGILSPFITALSALLIYSSFKEQLRANQIQISELSRQERRVQEEKVKNEYNASFDRATILINEVKIMLQEFTVYERRLNDNNSSLEEYKGIYGFNSLSSVLYIQDGVSLRILNSQAVVKNLKSILYTLKLIQDQTNSLPEDDPFKSVLIVKFNNMFFLYEEVFNDIRKRLANIAPIDHMLDLYEVRGLIQNILLGIDINYDLNDNPF